MNKLAEVNNYLSLIDKIINNDEHISTPERYFIGIDLGTADIQTVVIDENGRPIAAFLDWSDVVKDGIVVDYIKASQIVQSQVARVEQKLGITVERVITSYPPGTDPRISVNVVERAGVVVEKLIDEPSSVAYLLDLSSGVVVDIGGGTTGTVVIKNNKPLYSLDEPTGGRHISLVIAGHLKIDEKEAELLKRTSHVNEDIANIAKPVIEKMADIVLSHIQKEIPCRMYLTGGGTLVHGVYEVFSNIFPSTEIIMFKHALYLTPFAIAHYGLESINIE